MVSRLETCKIKTAVAPPSGFHRRQGFGGQAGATSPPPSLERPPFCHPCRVLRGVKSLPRSDMWRGVLKKPCFSASCQENIVDIFNIDSCFDQ
jgi:hypothetical protein